ncbi:MAG: AAA family ATPase [Abyssibacter sp.]|uniref:AAA family ATPase n=1 Tax=Abyssibacter sp. TaxID=2320200 RepID=UPI00321A34CF
MDAIETLETLAETASWRVLSGRLIESGELLLIKMAGSGHSREAATAALEAERSLRTHLNPQTNARIVEYRQSPALIWHVAARPMHTGEQWLRAEAPLSTDQAVGITQSLLKLLDRLHTCGRVLRGLHPGSWTVDDQGRVELLNLSDTQAIPSAAITALELALEQIAYLAPECSGRQFAQVDRRADLYAVGAMLYHMLTGEPPFGWADQDPVALLHRHLTQTPTRCLPADSDPVLADIVDKLLRKRPDERYQSAAGLQADLIRWQRGERSRFQLGEQDPVTAYVPSRQLFAREAQTRHVRDRLRQARGGALHCLLITGPSGIGKSAFAHHCLGVEPDLIWAEGKFDQAQRSQPYSAWQSIVRQCLAELRARGFSPDQLSAFTARHTEALSVLCPDPTAPTTQSAQDLSPEAQARMRYNAERLISELADLARPLVVFIDDLQWADSASLDLLAQVHKSEMSRHLLLVGAYRDNEAAQNAQLTAWLAQAHGSDQVSQLSLDTLDLEAIKQLLDTELPMAADDRRVVAEQLQAVSAGNPFFLRRVLMDWWDHGLLRMDATTGCWQPDLEGLQGLPLPSDVVDLVLGQLRRQPAEVQQTLCCLAGLDNQAELDELASLLSMDPESVRTHLETARQHQLIHWDAEQPRFWHDRIQEAAYALTAVAERPAVHLRLARFLHAAGAGDHRVMAQYLRCLDKLVTAEERAQVFGLATRTARAASAEFAHDVALQFYQAADALRPAEHWAQAPADALAFELALIRCELRSGSETRASNRIRALEQRKLSNLERAQLDQVLIERLIAQDDQHGALDHALVTLTRLGIDLPASDQALADKVQQLRPLIGRQTARFDLATAPLLTDPDAEIALSIMTGAAGAAYVMRPQLWQALTLEMMQLTLKHGVNPLSAFAYGFYAVLQSGVFGEIQSGERMGRHALALLERFQARPLEAKILNLYYVFVAHWTRPLRESMTELPRGFQSGIDHGDFEYGCYNGIQLGKHAVFAGIPLSEALRQQDRCIELIRKLHMVYHVGFAHVWRQFAMHLSDQGGVGTDLVGDDYDANALAAELEAGNSPFLVFNIRVSQLMICYLLDDPEAALAYARQAEAYAFGAPGMAELAEFNLYYPLVLLRTAPAEGLDQDDRHRIVQCYRNLRRWSRHAPGNFAPKADLVRAVCRSMTGRSREAVLAFEAAIAGAEQAQYPNVQALAEESFAEHWRREGAELTADHYLQRALEHYDQWGATAKLRRLREQLAVTGRDMAVPAAAQQTSLAALDSLSALKASTTITEQSTPESMRRELAEILVENAGAHWGCIGEVHAGQLHLLSAAGEQPEPGAETPALPETLIQAMLRSARPLIIHDIAATSWPDQDPALRRRRVLSAACLPLRLSGQTTGFVYLEQRSSPYAFSDDQVAVLTLLATQAATALRGIETQRELEQRVEARTRELAQANLALEAERQQLTRLSADLDTFASAASHDLQAPLRRISGVVDLLGPRLAEQLDTRDSKMLRMIGQSAQEASEQVQGLLQLARSSQSEHHQHAESLERIVAGALQACGDDAFTPDQLRLQGGEQCVHGNTANLRSLFQNLLSNAYRHRATDRPARVLIDARADNNRLHIRVEDDGDGIAPNDRERLLQPKQQGDGPKRGTLGLGLAICTRVVEAHGGQMRIEAPQDYAGASFVFDLPLATTAED